MRHIQVLSVILMVSALSAAVRAEDVWLEAEPWAPRQGETVAVHLVIGEKFSGRDTAYDPAQIDQFQRMWRSGRENLHATLGARPAPRFTTEEAGTQLIAYSGRPRFDPEQRVTTRHYCKLLIVAGAARSDSPLRYSELGQRLEIVPQSDPVALAKGGRNLQLQILFDREPLAGVTVIARSQAAPGTALRAVTDEIGLLALPLDQGGPWMIRVTHAQRDARGAKERFSSTLALNAGSR